MVGRHPGGDDRGDDRIYNSRAFLLSLLPEEQRRTRPSSGALKGFMAKKSWVVLLNFVFSPQLLPSEYLNRCEVKVSLLDTCFYY